ncbi:hypothetical protein [Pseudolysinimonas sp.]|uniref:hypothetical protein n=1 Tax=Pseudolysinimonas sp. TaxID=2680009 RepID=UPI0032660AD9
MKVLGGVILIGVLVLSGCSAAPSLPEAGSDLVISDVNPDSVPAFLSTPQGEDDVLPDEASALSIAPQTIRYQGEWSGKSVYLGVNGTSTVVIISGVPGDPATWGAGSSIGNVVIGMSDWPSDSDPSDSDPSDSDDVALQYLPQGSANPPDGWIALSPFLIVRS